MATQLNDWLTVDKISGTGNAEITLTASSYEEFVERTASLKIQGISANAILNVRQNAFVPKIEVEGDLVFSSYGGERTIRIKSNIGWRFESGDWYNFDKTQGNANVFTTITVTVDSNGGDERSAVIPIYKKDDDIIIGYITLIQNNANLTVEVPTDVENCFYIEPTVTDGRVIDIQFSFQGSYSVDNYYGHAYIYYYEDGTWKKFRPATAWNELHILKIQKRVYFKEFYRRNTSQAWQLKFNMSGEVNVGGDLSVLLGDVDNPYGYNTHLNRYAYYLFYGCPIVNASQLVLPTKMYYSAYGYMFAGCEKLIAAPELPSTTLAADCYWEMFNGCKSLTSAPALPATDLEEGCYYRMFQDCTSLTTAPKLPARILKNTCYMGMFYRCEKISHIEMLGIVIGDNSLSEWVYGVNTSGSFVKADNVILETGQKGIPDGWSVTETVYSPTVEELKSSYLWFEFENEDGVVSDFYAGIAYSFDGINWTKIERDSVGIHLETNRIVYLINLRSSLAESTNYLRFYGGSAKVGGVLSKINGNNYRNLFRGNTLLTDASELILPTTLSVECFQDMFRECSSLVNPPQLPATVLKQSCYARMFLECTSLVTAPELPATTLAEECYGSMFSGCTSLTTAPALPATTLAKGCYRSMFVNCKSLTSAALPATTLAEGCYNSMFRGCTNLTTVPVLPATTLAIGCYYSMFEGCTSLTTAPVLPATTLVSGCYRWMFRNCSKLNYIKMLAYEGLENTTCLYDWVYGVSSEGTFVKHPDADLPRGMTGIPSGWTVETATE